MRLHHLTIPSLLVCLACSPAETRGAAEATVPSDRSTTLAEGTHGMVSSAHPLATGAGLEILRQGGGAFDAAVAVASVLNVVEPMMSGMGGYGTILVYDAEAGEVHYLDASGKIPLGVEPDAYRPPTPDFEANRRGPKAVSTPGAVNAWEALAERFGKLPWPYLLEPAILLAEGGFVIDERLASHIAEAYDSFPPHAKAFYGIRGYPLRAGARLIQKDLASSLRQIQAQGAKAFYRGPLGAEIAEAMATSGGFLSAADLAQDRAEWWTPIRIPYGDFEVVAPSAPAGAFPMLMRLGMMQLLEPRSLGHNTTDYLHSFAEITKQAYWARLAFSGDPEIKAPPYETLLSEEHWRKGIAKIDPTRAIPFSYDGVVEAHTSDSTTHFVVADSAGNVVSATVTLGNLFGSRIMPEGTGIWLNNSLAYCTFEPRGNPMDAHPGRRKLSSDAPSIVLRNGRPWVALGTPGGHTITQTVAQMILNLVEFDMNLVEAISAPRIAFVEPNTLVVEPEIGEEVRAALAERGHEVQLRRLGNAHALGIERDAAGKPVRFIGTADPRGHGLAEGF